mmetsp:Transcript_11492/g.31330  ORF Transcript_11492/g.31330 Transcript_11492/m.31330 type:complete len:218 (+) Transcript_11492:163-816(+)
MRVASVMPRPPRRNRRSSRQASSTDLAPSSVTFREATVRSRSCLHPSAKNWRPVSEIVLSVPMPCCISLWGPNQRCRRHLQAQSTPQAPSPSGAKRESDRKRVLGTSVAAAKRHVWEPTARLRNFGSLCTNVCRASSLTSPTSRQESGKSRNCSNRGKAEDNRPTAPSSTPWQPCTLSATRLPRSPSQGLQAVAVPAPPASEPHRASVITDSLSGAA